MKMSKGSNPFSYYSSRGRGRCERCVYLMSTLLLCALVLLQSVAEIAYGSPLLFVPQQRDQLLLSESEHGSVEGSTSDSNSGSKAGDGVAYCSEPVRFLLMSNQRQQVTFQPHEESTRRHEIADVELQGDSLYTRSYRLSPLWIHSGARHSCGDSIAQYGGFAQQRGCLDRIKATH